MHSPISPLKAGRLSMHRLAWVVGIAGPLFWCVGCGGSSGVALAKVAGRITFYGRPARAEVIFQPLNEKLFPAGRPSTAITDAQGEYRLGFTSNEDGAVVGRQRVVVKILPQPDIGEPETMDDAIRPRKLVRLDRQVRPGRNRIDFALSY